MFDEDFYNTINKENRAEERKYNYKMKVVTEALQQLNPNCHVDIHLKLTLEGLSEEELTMPY